MNRVASSSASTGDATASGSDIVREYNFTEQDFERVRRMIHARAGISLATSKQDMVYSRLSRRLRSLGLARFKDYLDFLEKEGGDEWQAFVNALTTNLTSFFREPHHFEMLDKYLETLKGKPQVKIWCSAASTGEEPYSLAMTAIEHYGRLDPPVTILATDVDTQVLETAERGVYPLERVEQMSQERLKRFFRRGTGANEGYCKVNDELRRLISFEPLNLLDPSWRLNGPFDAIFCRNVMIYFDKPTQLSVLRKMVPQLTREGLFFAGHSESFHHAGELIRPIGRTVYALAAQAKASA